MRVLFKAERRARTEGTRVCARARGAQVEREATRFDRLPFAASERCMAVLIYEYDQYQYMSVFARWCEHCNVRPGHDTAVSLVQFVGAGQVD